MCEWIFYQWITIYKFFFFFFNSILLCKRQEQKVGLMATLQSLLPPQNSMGKNGLEWIRNYTKFGFLGTRDGLSMMLGVISVTSWSVAEIPQIISNYNQKSTEGLSLAFLFTWILGYVFFVFFFLVCLEGLSIITIITNINWFYTVKWCDW